MILILSALWWMRIRGLWKFPDGRDWLWEKLGLTLVGMVMLCCYIASVVSDSVWPHKRQPTRLLCPWDSPGKNLGVGCHCLLQCMHAKLLQSCPVDWPCSMALVLSSLFYPFINVSVFITCTFNIIWNQKVWMPPALLFFCKVSLTIGIFCDSI